MDRNLFRRIEVAFPVTSPDLQTRVTEDLLLYLADDCQAWTLESDGKYQRAGTAGHTSAQARLLSLYDERVALTES
jgi:polyphosphate kinase